MSHTRENHAPCTSDDDLLACEDDANDLRFSGLSSFLDGIAMGIMILFGMLVVLAVIASIASASGCASTTLHTPIGDYTSTKDTQLDHLIITIEKHADGSETTHVEVGGAGGQASTVIAAQGAIIQAAIEAGMAAGAKAVVPIP